MRNQSYILKVWIWVTSLLSFLILGLMGLHFEIQGASRRTANELEKVAGISQNHTHDRRFEIPGTRSE